MNYNDKSVWLINLVVMISVMVTSAIIGYRLSIKKKRNQTFWMVLCFIFNIWALIILWFLPVSKKNILHRNKG